MDDGFEAHLHTHHSVRMHSDVKLRRELVSGDFNQRIMKLAAKREQSDVEGATGVNMEYYGDAKIPLACDGFMSDENLAFASASARLLTSHRLKASPNANSASAAACSSAAAS